MKDTFSPSELFHIWAQQPVEAGDTLSGGDSVATLIRNRLIKGTDKGYCTTALGDSIVQKMIEFLEINFYTSVVSRVEFTPKRKSEYWHERADDDL